MQVFVFPILQQRFDNIPLYRMLMLLWPALFAILPFLSVLAQWSAPPEVLSPVAAVLSSAVNSTLNGALEIEVGGGMEAPAITYPAGPLLWTGIGVALAILRCAHMCYSLNVILIKNAAPSAEALGATFGLAQTVACVARAGSPAFVSTLFAMSKKYGLLGGNMVWVVMFGVALCGWWSTLYITDGPGPVGSNGHRAQAAAKVENAEECEMRML